LMTTQKTTGVASVDLRGPLGVLGNVTEQVRVL